MEQNIIFNRQTQILAIGPFARYYHFIRPELAFFGQAAVTYSHNFNLKDHAELTVNVTPGLTYFISSKVGLEMNIGGLTYKHGVHKPSPEYRTTSNLIDLRFINGSQIGVSFYLNR